MKIYYDKENDACAVYFGKDDTAFIYQTEEGMEIHSCKGGEPKIIKKQLLFSLDEGEDKDVTDESTH